MQIHSVPAERKHLPKYSVFILNKSRGLVEVGKTKPVELFSLVNLSINISNFQWGNLADNINLLTTYPSCFNNQQPERKDIKLKTTAAAYITEYKRARGPKMEIASPFILTVYTLEAFTRI